MYCERDQTAAVYTSEAMLLPSTNGRTFSSLRDIREWLQPLMASVWFRRNFPQVQRLELRNGPSELGAFGGLYPNGVCRLTIPEPMRSELIILHELAHGVGCHGHGRRFCSCYLQLVRHILGHGAWYDLKTNFVIYGVRHRRPPTPKAWRFDIVGAI